MSYPMSHPKQLIDKKALVKMVQYSPQHIARLEKAGKFPKRIKLGQTRGGERLCRDRDIKERSVVTV